MLQYSKSLCILSHHFPEIRVQKIKSNKSSDKYYMRHWEEHESNRQDKETNE